MMKKVQKLYHFIQDNNELANEELMGLSDESKQDAKEMLEAMRHLLRANWRYERLIK